MFEPARMPVHRANDEEQMRYIRALGQEVVGESPQKGVVSVGAGSVDDKAVGLAFERLRDSRLADDHGAMREVGGTRRPATLAKW